MPLFRERSSINIQNHNSGKVKSTKARRPYKIVLLEEFDDLKSARIREKYYKTGFGKKSPRSIRIFIKNTTGEMDPVSGRTILDLEKALEIEEIINPNIDAE